MYQMHKKNMSSDPYPLSKESASDDEGDINGIPAHNYSIQTFKEASSTPTSCRIHGRASLNFVSPDLCELGFAELPRRC